MIIKFYRFLYLVFWGYNWETVSKQLDCSHLQYKGSRNGLCWFGMVKFWIMEHRWFTRLRVRCLIKRGWSCRWLNKKICSKRVRVTSDEPVTSTVSLHHGAYGTRSGLFVQYLSWLMTQSGRVSTRPPYCIKSSRILLVTIQMWCSSNSQGFINLQGRRLQNNR